MNVVFRIVTHTTVKEQKIEMNTVEINILGTEGIHSSTKQMKVVI